MDNYLELDPNQYEAIFVAPLKQQDPLTKQSDGFAHPYARSETLASQIESLSSQIDPTSTLQYHVDQQTERLSEQGTKQLQTLMQQNEFLQKMVKKQEESISLLQSQNETLLYTNENLIIEISDNQKALKESKRNNRIMLFVAIVACLAALVSAVFTVKTYYSQHSTTNTTFEAKTDNAEVIND